MITLKRLNVVRKVATEEQAAKLERLGFARTGGTAEAPVGAGVTEADPPPPPRPPKRGKGGKGDDKEDQDGGTDQPGSGDGAK